MNLRTLGSIAMLGLAITGCGGGGGSSSADPVTRISPDASSPAPATPEPAGSAEPITATEQLSASDDFELGSSLDVNVQIDISGLNNSNGYLSICGATEDSAPDYENCFVRTALTESNYNGTLRLSTAIDVAYSAIWFLDMSRAPVVTRHELDDRAIEVRM